MATFNYTTREFREKQALILDKVDAGEDIIIHRGIKKSYMLVPVHKEDYTISEEFREKIAKAREDYKAGKGVTCRHCPQFCVNRKLQDSGFILESCFQI